MYAGSPKSASSKNSDGGFAPHAELHFGAAAHGAVDGGGEVAIEPAPHEGPTQSCRVQQMSPLKTPLVVYVHHAGGSLQ
jgi:hypothetical protein